MKASRIVTIGAAASMVVAVGLSGPVPAQAATAAAPTLTGTSITIASPAGDAARCSRRTSS